jgi:hypothetical protein
MLPGGPRYWSSDGRGARALRAAAEVRAARARRVGRLLIAVAAVAIASLAGAQGLWLSCASAQQAPRPSVTVASVVRGDAASRVPLPIQVGPPGALLKNSFIRIRGLPPAVALSEGHVIAAGVWAVPLVALPSLTVILPAGLQGESNVVITLVSVDGEVLAEVKMALVISPPAREPSSSAASQATPLRQAFPPPGLGGPPPPPQAPAERERGLGLHAKGVEQLERGNIGAARRFFERAVEAGTAQSAVALAGTYDPDELGKIKVVGLQPDIATARKWYEKARELGAPEAAERLRRLGSAR